MLKNMGETICCPNGSKSAQADAVPNKLGLISPLARSVEEGLGGAQTGIVASCILYAIWG